MFFTQAINTCVNFHKHTINKRFSQKVPRLISSGDFFCFIFVKRKPEKTANLVLYSFLIFNYSITQSYYLWDYLIFLRKKKHP